MWVVLRSHIFYFQDVAAFGAALDGAVAGHLCGGVVSEMVGVGDWGKQTVSQMVTWESAGYPVQPANCSSPADLTTIGLSSVPILPLRLAIVLIELIA